jgi:hypothetical protein
MVGTDAASSHRAWPSPRHQSVDAVGGIEFVDPVVRHSHAEYPSCPDNEPNTDRAMRCRRKPSPQTAG